MTFYNSAKVWLDKTALPNTCKTAKPNTPIKVTKGRVIEIKQAKYRMAEFGGTFLLSDTVVGELPKHGWHRLEVQCCWFGHRLTLCCPHFNINMDTAKEIKAPAEVFTNLSR